MPREGVDYSYARPGGARLKAEGKTFAVRYLHESGKGLTNSEIDDLWAHGLDIAVVCQEGKNNWQSGFAEGANQARNAQARLDRLKLDHGLPIYFTCDDPSGNQKTNLAIDFIKGAVAVLGRERVGIYGSYTVLNAVRNANVCDWYWQTYAWSNGNLAPFVNLYQYSNEQWNGQVDFTRAYTNNFGQLPPGTSSRDSNGSQNMFNALAESLLI